MTFELENISRNITYRMNSILKRLPIDMAPMELYGNIMPYTNIYLIALNNTIKCHQ